MANTIKEFSKELLAKTLKEYDTQKVRPIDARIDNIINNPGDGSTPTEVIDARKDIAGTVHPTLGKRIDAEMANVNSLFSTIEGSNISTDSLDGYLRNIEIKGNTIQNEADLADIKSVGDKLENQELYEIPLLCTNGNLTNPIIKDGMIQGANGQFDDGMSKDYCSNINYDYVESSTQYTIKGLKAIDTIFCYDKDKKYLSNIACQSILKTFTTPADCRYIRYRSLIANKTEIVQLEKGNAITLSYQKHESDKLTILSPVQIEKVGDVADRIVEKDGVWGVEKNVGSSIFNGSESWRLEKQSDTHIKYQLSRFTEKIDKVDSGIICNKFNYISVADGNVLNTEGICDGLNNGYSIMIIVAKTKNILSVEQFKTWLQTNPTSIKYIATTPTFIPLPHAQQVKLRTFANKTNISFLTEIEGTIKADVPKSLGATVNTHTTQIDGLHQELERVKKLEESTVSTVTTDKDFVSVEQTSNGYFEDVELKGRTLVNLCNPSKGSTGGAKYSVLSRFEAKPNTKYTFILNLSENIILNDQDGYIRGLSSGVISYTTKATSNRLDFLKASDAGVTINYEIVVLEGDHTQAPPSYFEGLKSVGDGTDEIVVSSVYGDGNLFDINKVVNGRLDNGVLGYVSDSSVIKGNDTFTCKTTVSNRGWVLDYTHVSPSTTYYNKCTHVGNIGAIYVEFYDNNKSFISRVVIDIGATLNGVFTTPNNCKYIRYYFNQNAVGESTISNIMINKGTTPKPYVPHKSDKKKLLYYNPTTSAWEKPVLREWDSVEKHADGKYWKHKRSEKVVFDGSGDWQIGNDTGNCIHFNTTNPITNIKISGLTISDKFNYSSSFSPDIECVNITGSGRIVIKILKSKLTTQDVAGFKQWLQANPTTVVYQLAKEEVYECTNIDLITYENETNFTVKSGVLSPKTTLKVHSNISNVVSLLQNKVSLLEQNIGSYMITQNRLMLTSRYNADTIGFEYSVSRMASTSLEYDEDLFMLLLENIRIGKNNYDREKMESIIDFYVMYFVISCEMAYILFDIIEEQHNIQEGNIDELY